jgi:hypothetical protein
MYTRLRTAATALLLCSMAAPVCHAAGAAAGAHEHQMSAADLATLRGKIEIYREYSDEQINASMARMQDHEFYVSPVGVRNEVGILALGHGYKEPGNTFFREAYARVAQTYPTATGLGMAMMGSGHIQAAVDRLTEAGARTIVALPSEIGDDTSLIRQWHYIFGLADRSAYLDVPRVKSSARIIVAKTPTASPLIGEILADYAQSAVRKPAEEVILLVAHGPEDPADNAKLLTVLARHAQRTRDATKVREVHADSLQDDAPTKIRDANVRRMREWITLHGEAGHRVIVLQAVMTGQGGVTARLRRDFDGLEYHLVDKGLAEHPLFDRWIRETVADELARPAN